LSNSLSGNQSWNGPPHPWDGPFWTPSAGWDWPF